LCFRVGLGREHCGLFVTIIEPLEQFVHPAIAIRQAKLLFDPDDCLSSAADIGIQPGGELVLLLVGQPSITAGIVEARECGFATTRKGVDPAFEGFGMGVEDAADRVRILSTVQKQDGVQTFGDAAIISLFEAPPQILALGAAKGKQLLAHGLIL